MAKKPNITLRSLVGVTVKDMKTGKIGKVFAVDTHAEYLQIKTNEGEKINVYIYKIVSI